MEIKSYRESKGLTARAMVDTMQQRYESYSSPVQTAVENPDRYGVRLTEDAEAHLIGVFGQVEGICPCEGENPLKRTDGG